MDTDVEARSAGSGWERQVMECQALKGAQAQTPSIQGHPGLLAWWRMGSFDDPIFKGGRQGLGVSRQRVQGRVGEAVNV